MQPCPALVRLSPWGIPGCTLCAIGATMPDGPSRRQLVQRWLHPPLSGLCSVLTLGGQQPPLLPDRAAEAGGSLV